MENLTRTISTNFQEKALGLVSNIAEASSITLHIPRAGHAHSLSRGASFVGERRSQVEPLKGKWSVVGGLRSVAAVGRKTCKTCLAHLAFRIRNKTNCSYLPVYF